ncbi:RNA methyltransferase [Salinirubrum litoreum]|uniref:RNA methyltransferase n=1 Tax=Salinirubrum litoreum TaxID=1126234 RepID=A0ABD5RA68_9EURY|nr:RNA methyltransferase [Salinirubrum litoreum]
MSEEAPATDSDGSTADGWQKPVVVVVDAETPGNVGTIARAMKNFGLSELKLVTPPPLEPDGEAYGFAGHAREDVLPNAEEVTFDEVVQNYHTVGFTAITNEDSRRHVRWPFTTPVELRETLQEVDTRTALVFGREGKGLNNDELARLDQVASIPASEEYPVMNLGQAATVVLYELRELTLDETQLPDPDQSRAPEAEIERFYDYFADFLDLSDHKAHKQGKTNRMIRRLIGRAHPTDREMATLLGVFRRANEKLRRAEGAWDRPASGTEQSDDVGSAGGHGDVDSASREN